MVLMKATAGAVVSIATRAGVATAIGAEDVMRPDGGLAAGAVSAASPSRFPGHLV